MFRFISTVCVTLAMSASALGADFDLTAFAESLRALPKASEAPLDEDLAQAKEGPSEQTLMTITSDAIPGQAIQVKATLDAEGKLTGIKRVGGNSGTIAYTLAQLGAGIVMLEAEGREIIRLTSKTVRAHDGGRAELKFLRNGITGATGTFVMDIAVEAGAWKVYSTRNNRRAQFTRMNMIKNTVFGRLVGIDRIEVR